MQNTYGRAPVGTEPRQDDCTVLNRDECSAVMVRVSARVPRGGMRFDIRVGDGAHRIEVSGCCDELDGVSAGDRCGGND
jgi:hypothetical protein